MSTNCYDLVLADLRAKHAAMGELIAALEHVSRLGPSSPPIDVPSTESVDVDRSSVRNREPANLPPARRRATEPTPEPPPDRRRTSERDEDLVRLVAKHPGLGASDVARKFSPREQDVTGLAARLTHNLKRLVAEGRLARHGYSYYPAGTPAPKEAP